MAFDVAQASGLVTVQDLGRFGGQRFGLGPAGAMDAYALRAANLIVGNAPGAAALEVGLAGLTLTARGGALVALTGVGCALKVQERTVPLWMAVWVQAGWSIELVRQSAGWAYLAVAGGIETPALMESRATHLRARLGGLDGRALRPGDVLPTGPAAGAGPEVAGRHIPRALQPAYSRSPTLAVVLGPQADAFTAEGLQTFLSSEYRVSAVSDRMGYRLEGPAVALRGSADIISEGVALGSVQVPAGGQPLVMMSERPTTGGYPKIATVISADLPLLAQAPPGLGHVRFRAVEVDEAQARLRQQMADLATSVHPAPD
jgi:antagonist of KipI